MSSMVNCYTIVLDNASTTISSYGNSGYQFVLYSGRTTQGYYETKSFNFKISGTVDTIYSVGYDLSIYTNATVSSSTAYSTVSFISGSLKSVDSSGCYDDTYLFYWTNATNTSVTYYMLQPKLDGVKFSDSTLTLYIAWVTYSGQSPSADVSISGNVYIYGNTNGIESVSSITSSSHVAQFTE